MRLIWSLVASAILTGCANTYNLYSPNFKNDFGSDITAVPVSAEVFSIPEAKVNCSEICARATNAISTGIRLNKPWFQNTFHELNKNNQSGAISFTKTSSNQCSKILHEFVLNYSKKYSPSLDYGSIEEKTILKETNIKDESVLRCIQEIEPTQSNLVLLNFSGKINPDIFEETPKDISFLESQARLYADYYFPKKPAYFMGWYGVLLNRERTHIIGSTGNVHSSKLPQGGKDERTDISLPKSLYNNLRQFQNDKLNLNH